MKHYTFLLNSLLLLVIPGIAHAYLDPGTGSFIFQMLIAGLLGALFYIKIVWGRAKYFINNLFNKQERNQTETLEVPEASSKEDIDK